MKYHLVGIGGSMMSGLAEILKNQGHEVTGSDLSTTGHSPDNIGAAERLVYSPAVKVGSPGYVELEAAKAKKVPTIRLEDLVAELTSEAKLVAITGTHGKSSTTGMVATILVKAGLNPTVLLGAPIPDWQGQNYRVGNPDLWVIEADDYDRKFLKYNPDLAIITNIEAEHLDIYKSLEDVEQAFGEFVKRVVSSGVIIAHNDPVVRKVVSNNFEMQEIHFYDADDDLADQLRSKLKLIGEHQLENAIAAVRLCEKMDIAPASAIESLADYHGVGRRLEYIGSKAGVEVYDDYGHHPTELKVTISALKKKFPDRRLVVAFQAHQHSRVAKLYNDFLESFGDADKVFAADIYAVPGREEEEYVDSRDFAKDIASQGVDVVYAGDLDSLSKLLDSELKSGDVFVTIGATDITQVGRQWIKS
ncbi:UDP-N-acetylmuramate--L-alanine ligase [Candidatus Berkelbacteria bacterium]|nr:UDP-N-acetylmuramate--L-alanine ligase [Candidatus Berkelbacteria bacterium]